MATVEYVWGYWVDDATSTASTTATLYADDYSTTASASTTDTVWRSWAATGGNGATVTGTTGGNSEGIWKVWVHTDDSTVTYVSTPTKELTAKEKRARQEEVDRRMREAEERRKKEKIEKEAAEAKAKELLLELIGPDELEVYDETGRLFVAGRKYDYIIQKQGKLMRLEKDKITDLCVHLRELHKFPRTDNVIALLMMLLTDEDYVLKLANNHGSRDKPVELPKYARAA